MSQQYQRMPAPGGNGASLGAPLDAKLYGSNFGIVADGRDAKDAVTAAGSPVITSATMNWTAADVGKLVMVATSDASPSQVSQSVVGTVLSVNPGANQATISANAPTTAGSLQCFVGTDNATALQAAVTAAETTVTTGTLVNGYRGGVVSLPRGIILTSAGVVFQGAKQIDDRVFGGVGFRGDGQRSTVLVLAALTGGLINFGVANTSAGTTTATPLMHTTLRELSLIGPGKYASTTTVGIDRRVTGDQTQYENVLIVGFYIGWRSHDVTALTTVNVNVRRCYIGVANGFASDAHAYMGLAIEYCNTGMFLGYTDTARGQADGTNAWHASSISGGLINDCGVGIYIVGFNRAESFTIRETYFEQWADVAVRIGDSAFAHSVNGHVVLDNVNLNGQRVVNDDIGSAGIAAFAVEVNSARSVHMRGGSVRGCTSVMNIRSTNAMVRIDPGDYDTAPSGATYLGDVQLPDSTFQTIYGSPGQQRPITYGTLPGQATSYCATLPTASAAWLGSKLRLYSTDTEYKCEANGSGGYAWYAMPTAKTLGTFSAPSNAPAAYIPTNEVRESITRRTPAASISVLASGSLLLIPIYLEAGDLVASLGFLSGSTALATGANQWAALYDPTRNKLAVSADDTSNAWASGTTKVFALTSSYTVTTAGLYYAGLMVKATTVPTLVGASIAQSLLALPPILCGLSNGSLTDPTTAPATANAPTAAAGIPYAYTKST